MIVVVDRFEENFAVCECEDKTMINIEISKLPNNVREGDVLVIKKDNIEVDYNETKRRREEIEKLVADMWE